MTSIPLRIGADQVELRLDWSRVEQLCGALGSDWDSALNAAFEEFDIDTVAIALGIATGRPADEIKAASPPWLHARETFMAGYSLFMFGVPSLQDAQNQQEEAAGGDSPLPHRQSSPGAAMRLIERAWRRASLPGRRSTRSPSGSAPDSAQTANA